MTNPYQSPTQISPQKQNATRYWRSLLVGGGMIAFSTVFFVFGVVNAIQKGMFELIGSMAFLYMAYFGYRIVKRDEDVRRRLVGFCRIAAVVVAVILTWKHTTDPPATISLGPFVLRDVTTWQLAGVSAATVFLVAFPWILLGSSAGKREFVKVDA